ncbi:hypothetical protein FEM48_Zijuj01G0074800 [Ziziphus jujuba var. spinosa]|uniref:PGG domain-containing protein n=1 Tax=Ziziphus jujuba var. spinosa TaxID=714518 RepID=A0A978VZX6_ZIZJJ|nr:hypothetical protein FEM48_Zijuj01G0074800 [Ziziphus jujuba var. spinosa]
MTRPYRAAMEGKLGEVKIFYQKYPERLQAPLTVNGDTAIHIAVFIRDMKLLKSLLQILKSQSEESPPFPILGDKEEEESLFQVKNLHGQTALHLAAADGNLEALNLLLCKDEKLLNIRNDRGETPLFVAASYGKTEAVKYLYRRIKEDKKPHVERKDKTSILHVAILGEYFETAVELLNSVNWDDVSPDAVDANGTTGFQLLANMPSAFKSAYRMGKFKTLLYYCLPNVDYAENYDKGKLQVTSGRNEVDLESGSGREDHEPSNEQTENRPSVFPTIQMVWNDKKKHNKALELAKILAKADLSWKHGNTGGAPSHRTDEWNEIYDIFSKDPGDEEEKQEKNLEKIHTTFKDEKVNVEKEDETPPTTFRSRFLYETPFIAAGRNGILEIVKAVLDVYPQAIEHVNKQNENIFHVVAKYRSAKILDYLLSSSNVPVSRQRNKLNTENGDSILHGAAYLSASSSRDRPGEALLMQSDLQWFEILYQPAALAFNLITTCMHFLQRIKKIVPYYFINHQNYKRLTAQELFTEQHKQLLQDGQEWLRRTAEACTIVAVLIATVAFTCAYTVPGGSTDTGHPLLLKATPFSVFATSDALSLCFSLTSVVVFLSIMTSKMNEQDFRMSLPLKLLLGLTTLFLSVAFMMVAFSATLLLMIRERLHWAAIPIYTVACCPVTIFLLLQFPLYLNISWFTVTGLFTAK